MEDILNFRKHYRYLFAVCSGILLLCSYPTVNFFPLAWIGLVPLLLALENVKSWKTAFSIGYVAGFLFFAGLLLAISLLYPYANIFTTVLGYLLLVGYTALYFAVASVLVYHLPWQSGILYPLGVATIWVSLEWVRSWLLTGFPWGNIGYSQWNNQPGIQIASFAGVYIVSFVVVFFNAGIASIIRGRNNWRKELVAVTVPCLLVTICFIYGYVSINKDEKIQQETIEVALVPGNIPQIEKWKSASFPKIFARYLNLTKKVAEEKPDVIVWPETTVRGEVLSGEWKSYHSHFIKMLDGIGGIPMLVGATDLDTIGDLYNRVISVSPEGEILGKYAKMRLVPFGEYVPLADFLPNFVQFHPFEQGRTVNLLPIAIAEKNQNHNQTIEVGISICFESSFPNHFRRFVKKGANAMGILTNDAWFAGTALPELHLAMAPFRAVENRVAVFRCANGGYSCAVDKFGGISTPFVTPNTYKEFIVASIALSDGNHTLYTRYGDWLPILCVLLSLPWIIYTIIKHYSVIKSEDRQIERK